RRRPPPVLGHMPRPIAQPPLKPLKPAPPKGEQVMKPIAKITQEMLDQAKGRQLRPEDLLKPSQPVATGDIADESDEARGKRLKEIPGRDARTQARNERANKRKAVRAEAVEIRGNIVIERDDQVGRSLSKLRKKQKHQPGTQKPKGKIQLVMPITVRTLSE